MDCRWCKHYSEYDNTQFKCEGWSKPEWHDYEEMTELYSGCKNFEQE